LDALYQKQILQLAQHSRTSTLDPDAQFQASYDNPTCGDRVHVSFSLKGGLIHNLGIEVRGCALCEAGAGLMLEHFEGEKALNVKQLTAGFSDWIEKRRHNAPNVDMEKFMPVREIRNRHKCVLIAFQAVVKALS
jgi:nitrogen fixation NifU-like protein